MEAKPKRLANGLEGTLATSVLMGLKHVSGFSSQSYTQNTKAGQLQIQKTVLACGIFLEVASSCQHFNYLQANQPTSTIQQRINSPQPVLSLFCNKLGCLFRRQSCFFLAVWHRVWDWRIPRTGLWHRQWRRRWARHVRWRWGGTHSNCLCQWAEHTGYSLKVAVICQTLGIHTLLL